MGKVTSGHGVNERHRGPEAQLTRTEVQKCKSELRSCAKVQKWNMRVENRRGADTGGR